MMVQSDALARLAGIRHGFFTREGGVSQGLYASLNGGIGSNDSRECVAENRARMAEAVGHPVAVNPDRRLRSIARARAWPTIRFSGRAA